MKGLTTGPLAAGDVEQVTRVWRTCEQHDDGEALFAREDIVAITQRPSFDFGAHSIAVRDGDELVALGLLLQDPQAFVHVLPTHRGRGIGSWLLRWIQDAGRAAGHASSRQPVSENERAAVALLRAEGFTPRWESWLFELALEREPDPPRLAPGCSIRALRPGSGDDRTAHRVIDEAFGEWPDRDPWPFDDWAAQTLGRPGFRPDHLALAECGGEVVGAAVLIEEQDEEWVDQLAVAGAHRGRGIGRALLAHAFGVAWRRGARRCGLGNDSRTGARGLYEHVGMHVRRTYTEYGKAL